MHHCVCFLSVSVHVHFCVWVWVLVCCSTCVVVGGHDVPGCQSSPPSLRQSFFFCCSSPLSTLGGLQAPPFSCRNAGITDALGTCPELTWILGAGTRPSHWYSKCFYPLSYRSSPEEVILSVLQSLPISAWNLIYSGGWDRRIINLRSAWAI